MEKEKKNFPKEFTLDEIKLQPFYHDIRNRIIKPRSVVQETRYFWNRWRPLLGPVLTILIMDLRSRCYVNQKTGERREYCSPSCEKIAKVCGISVITVKRYLGKSFIRSHPYLHLFLRTEPKYIYNEILKKKVKVSNTYYVAMDDPLIPEDEGELAVLAAERLLEKHNKKENDLSIKKILRLPGPVDNSSPKYQIDTNIYKYQNDTALNNTLNNTNNVNNVRNADKNESLNKRILNSKSKVKCLVEDMVIQLEDTHSGGFFKKIAELCPDNLIYRALSEVKEESNMGKIKKSKGACFTDKITRMAKKAGIILSTKKGHIK